VIPGSNIFNFVNMPQFANGGTRTKTVRENYVERLSYGRGES